MFSSPFDGDDPFTQDKNQSKPHIYIETEPEVRDTLIPSQLLLSGHQHNTDSSYTSSPGSSAPHTPILDPTHSLEWLFPQPYSPSGLLKPPIREYFGRRHQNPIPVRPQELPSPAYPYENSSGTEIYSHATANANGWYQGSMGGDNDYQISSTNQYVLKGTYPLGATSSPFSVSDGDGVRSDHKNWTVHTPASSCDHFPHTLTYQHDVPWSGSSSIQTPYDIYRDKPSPITPASSPGYLNSPAISDNCDEFNQSGSSCEELQSLLSGSMSISGRQPDFMSHRVGLPSNDKFEPVNAIRETDVPNTLPDYTSDPYPILHFRQPFLNTDYRHDLQTQPSSHNVSGVSGSHEASAPSHLSGAQLHDSPWPTGAAENPIASPATSPNTSNSLETLLMKIKLEELDILLASCSVSEAAQSVETLVQQTDDTLYREVFERARTERLDISEPGRAASERRRTRMKGEMARTLFSCILCPASLTTKDNLKNHYKSHLKLYSLVCPRCGSPFTTQAGLKRHTRKAKRCKDL